MISVPVQPGESAIAGGDYHAFMVRSCWAKKHEVSIADQPKNFYKKVTYGHGFILTVLGTIAYSSLRLILTSLSRRRDYGAIVSPSHYPQDTFLLLLLKIFRFGSRYVVYFHGAFPEIPDLDRRLTRSLSLAYNLLGVLITRLSADLVFVFNTQTRDQLTRLGVSSKKIVLSENGVSIPEQITRSRKSFDACFVGRLTKSKGIFDVLRLSQVLREQSRRSIIAVVGDGPEKNRVEDLIAKERLEGDLLLLGIVSETSKYKVLSEARVFVFPSYHEGWCIAIAEALSCGLPVVAYNLPIYDEVFNEELIKVSTGDVNAMVREVVYLLDNPEIARNIGERGREFVKRYEWNEVAEKELCAILRRDSH